MICDTDSLTKICDTDSLTKICDTGNLLPSAALLDLDHQFQTLKVGLKHPIAICLTKRRPERQATNARTTEAVQQLWPRAGAKRKPQV